MNRRFISAACLVVFLLGLTMAIPALAADPPQQGGDDAACLACHDDPSMAYEFPGGEVWSLYVDRGAYQASSHGQEGLACTSCHADIDGYPHPPVEAGNARYFQLEKYKACQSCHPEVYAAELDSVHAREIAAGNWNAAICTDCHDPHDNQPDQPRTQIPVTCSKCHSGIYNEYLDSVHGHALVDERNLDVPTCIDCHGVHNQEDPRTTAFRLNSPELCASCHANETMMSAYGISTNVFNTYVADFHGTTVTLFERQSPDIPSNKPVCYDCHGVHNMKRPDDPTSQIYADNLLHTCQKCHPDATGDFPASWLSHYEPDIQTYPLVYFVDLFYKILIPAVIGFMVIYVVLEGVSRLVRRPGRKEGGEA